MTAVLSECAGGEKRPGHPSCGVGPSSCENTFGARLASEIVEAGEIGASAAKAKEQECALNMSPGSCRVPPYHEIWRGPHPLRMRIGKRVLASLGKGDPKAWHEMPDQPLLVS